MCGDKSTNPRYYHPNANTEHLAEGEANPGAFLSEGPDDYDQFILISIALDYNYQST